MTRRIGFSSGWPCSSLLADAAEQSRWSVSSTTRSGWTGCRRRRSRSSRAASSPSRSALVFAVREPERGRELDGLPELVVSGLGDGDARALLDTAITGRLDERVHDRIIAETRGNPLALLELPRGLTAAELAGGFALPDARHWPAASSRASCTGSALPAATRRLLLVAAAEPIGDGACCGARPTGSGSRPMPPRRPRSAELIEFGARVRFRHPLVRSAAYRAATSTERREVHRALAEATDPDTDPDRRAWHRAHAAAGPDEVVAHELERSAGAGAARGGRRSRCRVPRAGGELTPDPGRRATACPRRSPGEVRGRRARRGIRAARDRRGRAARRPAASAARTAPRADRLRAHTRRDAPPLLLAAARRLEPLDAALARETYLEALRAAIFAGRLDGAPARQVGRGHARRASRASLAASDRSAAGRPRDAVHGRVRSGRAPLRRALARSRASRADGDDDMRWLWLACRRRAARTICGTTSVARRSPPARSGWLATSGALNVLPLGAHVPRRRPRPRRRVRRRVGSHRGGRRDHAGDRQHTVAYTSLLLAAWRGVEPEALRPHRGRRSGMRPREARDARIGLADYATAVLHNGLGRYGEALGGRAAGV